VSIVGLFVNPAPDFVREALAKVPLQVLQFHGDEQETNCVGFGLPYIKAARMRPGLDLLKYAACFPGAQGLLVDAFVEGYGGGGETFDWSLIPSNCPCPDPFRWAQCRERRRGRPACSALGRGCVERRGGRKGIKDAVRIIEFVAGVQHAHG
jgi:phosphoribosylanthranilate isomerase